MCARCALLDTERTLASERDYKCNYSAGSRPLSCESWKNRRTFAECDRRPPPHACSACMTRPTTAACMQASSGRAALSRDVSSPGGGAGRGGRARDRVIAPVRRRRRPLYSGGARFFLPELPSGPRMSTAPPRVAAPHAARAAVTSASAAVEVPPSLSDPHDALPRSSADPRVSRADRNDSASFSAACAAICSAARRCFGELGGENVGEGDLGVGGRAVSFQTRCVTSLSPSAAARVSRSSSAAESTPAVPARAAASARCRFGEPGGEHVGEGERGVGGRLRSSAAT